MTSRRTFLSLAGAALSMRAAGKLPIPLGMQIYSLRREVDKDLPGTLALIRKLGFTELEVGGFYRHTPAEFKRMLADNGLHATALGASWEQLLKSAAQVGEQARELGVEYVTCSAIPRQRRQPMTMEDTVAAADNFNRWGETLAGTGQRFCYHAHGPEFVSGPDGTLFDTLIKRMDPKFANIEMDVFWFVFGNQDPVKMMERYRGRFALMHVKDIRKGEKRTPNFDPGPVREEASVPLGKGEIDWPPVLRAAKSTGVLHYYIEEEHPNAVAQIQESLGFLENLKL